jgi:phosphonate transport system substrate-binding protein
MTRLSRVLHASLYALWAILLVACSATPSNVIDLGGAAAATPTAPAGQATLRIAVAAMISPNETFGYYQDLLSYIGKKMGRPVELVQRKTYDEVNDLLEARQLDAAFVCAGPYVTGHDKFGMELVAAPVVSGETLYYAYIIVSADSTVQSFADLRGKSFAFTDPSSNTGKLVPTYMLARLGETPESYFSSTTFTHSHDNSIQAVADKVIDGASVDSLIYDYLAKTDPELIKRTRIVEKSPAYGMPPIVVHPATDPQLKQQLASILLNMHEDPEGLAILQKLNIQRFATVTDDLYQSVREMNQWITQQQK